jgi:predicted metal-dependent enzyme (double-stranded beta helix superfamily)
LTDGGQRPGYGPPAVPELARLVEAVSDVLDTGGDLHVVTAGIVAAMTGALQREELVPLFAGRDRSFEAFADPRRHFVVHCSVHAPGHLTEAHDHGEAWAVYGVVRGRSRYRRFRRGGDLRAGWATLLDERDEEIVPGQTDVVAPGQVHLVANESTEPAWNVVVRPRPLAEVWRRRFDLSSGAYQIHPHSLPASGRA